MTGVTSEGSDYRPIMANHVTGRHAGSRLFPPSAPPCLTRQQPAPKRQVARLPTRSLTRSAPTRTCGGKAFARFRTMLGSHSRAPCRVIPHRSQPSGPASSPKNQLRTRRRPLHHSIIQPSQAGPIVVEPRLRPRIQSRVRGRSHTDRKCRTCDEPPPTTFEAPLEGG